MRRTREGVSPSAGCGHSAALDFGSYVPGPGSCGAAKNRLTRSPRRHGRAALVAPQGRVPWRPEVDYQIEFGWPHHWQASGFLPMENAPGIDAALTLLHPNVDAIAHQTARLRVG